MFIVAALYKKLPIEIMGLKQEIDLTNHKRLGFFPVFQTKEQANEFAENMLLAQGIKVNIIEFNEVICDE